MSGALQQYHPRGFFTMQRQTALLSLFLFCAALPHAASGGGQNAPPKPPKLGAGLAQLSLEHITSDAEAVCNDGSLAGMFIAQTTDVVDHQADWLVYLQGGDWCYSQETCDQVRGVKEKGGGGER